MAFWLRHGVHHPFLLPGYRGAGQPYHQNFAKVGLKSEDAGRVSFVELLNVPTIGGRDLAVEDLEPRHLDELNALILGGTQRNVFLSDKVAKLMRRSGRFRWLCKPIAYSGERDRRFRSIVTGHHAC